MKDSDDVRERRRSGVDIYGGSPAFQAFLRIPPQSA